MRLRREPRRETAGQLVHVHLGSHARACGRARAVLQRAHAARWVDAQRAIGAPEALFARTHGADALAPPIAPVVARARRAQRVGALGAPPGGLAHAHVLALWIEVCLGDLAHDTGRVEPARELGHEDTVPVARTRRARGLRALVQQLQHRRRVDDRHRPALVRGTRVPALVAISPRVVGRAVLEAHATHEEVGVIALRRAFARDRERGLGQAARRVGDREAPHGRTSREHRLRASLATQVRWARALARRAVACAIRRTRVRAVLLE
mmetsp:Transcript_22676/g.58339  ORF Transcript_22676/g.58339 Transcript_22676/m.58339 type:complete len:266 (-) Transcript_22676:418-1215(-)